MIDLSDKQDAQGGAKIAPPDPWDPLVRVTHWVIAGAVLWNGLISKPGGTVHVWIGWIALVVLALRILWGFVGPREARFASFLPDPRRAVAHLLSLLRGRVREHPSHNPAGAIMVYALWLSLALVIATGLQMTEWKNPVTISEEKAAVAAGDWSVLVNNATGSDEHSEDMSLSRLIKKVHELAANLMLVLAVVHVAGVAVESMALKRNLVRPMIRGRS